MTILTQREQRMLDLIRQGKTNSQIAVEMKINPTAVNRDLRSLKRKMNAKNKQALMISTQTEEQTA